MPKSPQGQKRPPTPARIGEVLCGVIIASIVFLNCPVVAKTELLSLDGIALGAGQYIDKFTITTWRAEVVSVCHMPPSWQITAGNFVDPEGVLAGESAVVAAIRKPQMEELKNLFLMNVSDYKSSAREGERPATFSGWVYIGKEGNDFERKVRLRPSNYVLTSAQRCPNQDTLQNDHGH